MVTASFTNTDAVVSWLSDSSGKDVILLPAGEAGSKDPRAAEDLICAETLRDIFVKEPVDWAERFAAVEKYMRSIYNPEHLDLDLRLIFDCNCYPVVPLCRWKKEGLICVSDASKQAS